MNLKYFRWQLRRWLGFGLVYLLLSLALVILAPLLIAPSDGLHLTETVFLSAHTIPIGFGAGFGVIMAGLTFSYRYSRKSSDYFLSLPAKPMEIRLARIAAALLYVVVPYLLSFWLLAAVVAGRFGAIDTDFLFASFGYGLAGVILSYLLALYPFSRGKTAFEAVFLYVAVTSLFSLDLLPYAIYAECGIPQLYQPGVPAVWSWMYDSCFIPIGAVFPASSYVSYLAPAVLAGELAWEKTVLFAVKASLFLALSLASGLSAVFLKEPSGEKMGVVSRGPTLERYAVHFFFAELALIVGSAFFVWGSLYVISIILIVVFLAFYYSVISLYNRSFVPKLYDLPGYGASLLFFLIGFFTVLARALS